jgi:hypothetical protein
LGLYTGDLENLYGQVQSLPAVYILQREAVYGEMQTIKYRRTRVDIAYWVLVLGYVGSDKKFDIVENETKNFDTLIANIRDSLAYFNTSYGYLIPRREETVFISEGFSGYVLEFNLEYIYEQGV